MTLRTKQQVCLFLFNNLQILRLSFLNLSSAPSNLKHKIYAIELHIFVGGHCWQCDMG